MRAFLGTCFIAFVAPAPRVERLSLAAAVLALAVTFPLEALAQEVTLRWIARDFPAAFVTPYLIAGYAWTDAKLAGGSGVRLLLCAVALGVSVTLSSCGGGGGDGGEGVPVEPPFIDAELHSFPPGSAPAGFTNTASVIVLDNSTGNRITTAPVTINGVTLAYNAVSGDYEGNVTVAPAGAVTVSVTVGSSTYTVSANQFNSFPSISAPLSGASWASSNVNTVTWSGGDPSTGAFYSLGLLDTADPNGSLVWPSDQSLQVVPIGTTSFPVPALSITGGSRILVVGIGKAVDYPGAASGSSLRVTGFNYVPITVTGMPVTPRTSGTTSSLFAAAWSGTKFATVGGTVPIATIGTVITSPDGVTWTSQTIAEPDVLFSVAWSGTQFAAVGQAGLVFTSPDGITWKFRKSGTTFVLLGVVWSGTQFVAVGYNTILTSPDGITWTSRTPGATGFLNAVAWSGTQFVAVGGGGAVYTSPDGITWTAKTSGTANSLNGVAWSGTQFVAVGESGTLLTSPDGTTWTPQTSGTANFLYGVASSGTQFVAVGVGGTLLTSPDGTAWTPQASGTVNLLNGVVWSGTQFVMLGANGTILTSP